MEFASDTSAEISEGGASDFNEKYAVDAGSQSSKAGLREELVDGGNLPQKVRLFGRQDALGLDRHEDISPQGGRRRKV